jgi:hypothetical protein
MKTNELTGAALNWAVGKAEGLDDWLAPVNYCGKWEHGGPIIERERLQVTTERNGTWICSIPFAVEIGGYRKYIFTHGPTPLIAAMRCYVASKLGEDVSIPEELK